MNLVCRLRAFTSTVLLPAAACGQDLEPRAYAASPVGTNFAIANFTRLFGLAGRVASVGIGVPFTQGDMSRNVFDAPRDVRRAGLGDVRMRFAFNLIGAAALTLSVPVAAGWSGKMSWSTGWATRAGGDFKAVSVTLQRRWFDR